MRKVRHTRLARRDLLDIWLGIATHTQAAAERTYDRLEARIQALEPHPEIGPARTDIAVDARALVEQPCLILYQVIPDGIQIVRVLHGARDIDEALSGRVWNERPHLTPRATPPHR
jgi:toxin ParE1/3/4